MVPRPPGALWLAALGSFTSFAWFAVFLAAGVKDDVQRVGAVLTGATSALLGGLTYSHWLRWRKH